MCKLDISRTLFCSLVSPGKYILHQSSLRKAGKGTGEVSLPGNDYSRFFQTRPFSTTDSTHSFRRLTSLLFSVELSGDSYELVTCSRRPCELQGQHEDTLSPKRGWPNWDPGSQHRRQAVDALRRHPTKASCQRRRCSSDYRCAVLRLS
jgi:hypothetical protein